MSGLTEYPEQIENLIANPEINASGIYVVCLYINGVRTPVIVDDYIPCNPGTNRPAFVSTNDEEVWPLLVEKAYAKIHGNYHRIEGGHPFRASVHLGKCLQYLYSDLTRVLCFSWSPINVLF